MPHLVRTRARAGGLASPPSGEVPGGGGGGGGERASAFFGGGSMVGWGVVVIRDGVGVGVEKEGEAERVIL